MTATLTGSERQIAWANNIRAETLAEVNAADLPADVRAETIHQLAEVTAASWWISTRDIPGDEWPARLGLTVPAVEQRPLQRKTDAAKQRLASRMAVAAELRDRLDEAGVARTDYGLTIRLNDSLSVHPIDSGTSPESVAARRALADKIIQALEAVGRPVRSPAEARMTLAAGSGILID